MRHLVLAAAIAMASLSSAPASAASDFNGAAEIQRGDYAAAERVIAHQLRMWPGDADLLLNLATVYRQTGRVSEARALYRSILAQPDDVMDLPSRAPQSSHALARSGLTTIDRTQLSAAR